MPNITTTANADTHASQSEYITVKRSDLQEIKALADELATALHYIETSLYSCQKHHDSDLTVRVANVVMGSVYWQSQTTNFITESLENLIKGE